MVKDTLLLIMDQLRVSVSKKSSYIGTTNNVI